MPPPPARLRLAASGPWPAAACSRGLARWRARAAHVTLPDGARSVLGGRGAEPRATVPDHPRSLLPAPARARRHRRRRGVHRRRVVAPTTWRCSSASRSATRARGSRVAADPARPTSPTPGATAAAATPRRQPAQHPRPLRPRQRALRAVPRPDDGLLVRPYYERADDTLEQAQQQQVPAAGPRLGPARRPTTCSRSAAAGAGFAMHAARTCGCRVTAITVSREQFELAAARVAAAGLADRVDIAPVRLPRRRRGSYDRIVSIEMLEAVGREFWPAFFEAVRPRCSRRAGASRSRPSRMPDDRFERYARARRLDPEVHLPGRPAAVHRRAARRRRPRARRSTLRCVERHRAALRARRCALARCASSSASTRCARSASTTASSACGSTTSRPARRCSHAPDLDAACRRELANAIRQEGRLAEPSSRLGHHHVGHQRQVVARPSASAGCAAARRVTTSTAGRSRCGRGGTAGSTPGIGLRRRQVLRQVDALEPRRRIRSPGRAPTR